MKRVIPNECSNSSLFFETNIPFQESEEKNTVLASDIAQEILKQGPTDIAHQDKKRKFNVSPASKNEFFPLLNLPEDILTHVCNLSRNPGFFAVSKACNDFCDNLLLDGTFRILGQERVRLIKSSLLKHRITYESLSAREKMVFLLNDQHERFELAKGDSFEVLSSDPYSKEIPHFISEFHRYLIVENFIRDYELAKACCCFKTNKNSDLKNCALLASEICYEVSKQNNIQIGKKTDELRQLLQNFATSTQDTLTYCGSYILQEIPQEFFKLKGLETLIFTNDKIFYVPNEIVNLTNLSTINFSKNCLRKLPKSMWEMINLKNLNLSENKLTKISKNILKLENLDELNISGNELQSIPFVFSLPNLKKLIISRDQFDKFDNVNILNDDRFDISENIRNDAKSDSKIIFVKSKVEGSPEKWHASYRSLTWPKIVL